MSDLNLKELERIMKEAPKLPANSPKAVVMPYSAVAQLRRMSKPSHESVFGSMIGFEILSLNDMPETEALMFTSKQQAYDFVKLANAYGYEHTKKRFQNLISIENIGTVE